jgi:predicted HTH domain antitoxin
MRPFRQLAFDGGCAYKFVMSAATDNIVLEIPRELPQVTKMTLAELRQELAFALFAQGKISFGKARELAGLTVWQFQNELGKRGIPPHYDTEDFAEDVGALRELGRL